MSKTRMDDRDGSYMDQINSQFDGPSIDHDQSFVKGGIGTNLANHGGGYQTYGTQQSNFPLMDGSASSIASPDPKQKFIKWFSTPNKIKYYKFNKKTKKI